MTANLDPHRLTLVEGAGEWSALYLDGELVDGPGSGWGDHDVVHEHLLTMLGVQTRQTDCLVTPNVDRWERFRGVALTLDELDQREHTQSQLRVQAELKRAEAKALLDEAEQIERSIR